MPGRRVVLAYFAHSVNLYEEPEREARIIMAIKNDIRAREGADVVPIVENPNQMIFQIEYAARKQATMDPNDNTKHDGMGVFWDLCEAVDYIYFMGYRDGMIGMGVAGEAARGAASDATIVEVLPDGETFVTAEDPTIVAEDSPRVLSILETRGRTSANPEDFGSEKIPYDVAHLIEGRS